MTETSTDGIARRFLHICYCCNDVDPVTSFFVEGLAMRNTMRTPPERSSGAILGFPGEIEGCASFVYDRRGPRTSPAIEVQSWVDPKLVGTPSVDPFEVGIKAIGFAVPDLAAAQARLTALGCQTVVTGPSPFGPKAAMMRDSNGVTIELVEDETLAADATQMDHLRITCTDIDTSLKFYEQLGFLVVERRTFEDAAFVGVETTVDAELVKLRLPDEPFEVLLIQWRDPSSHGRHYAEPNHAGLFRTALCVDDTRQAYAALSAAGIVFDRAPMAVTLRGTPVPDMWICFVSDPDGVAYEFVQRPRSVFR
jgi:catechol 2,3-dioxygenase-like lactoylglutathione lyase family enzyme